MNLVVRTYQDSGVWVGRRGRIEGDRGRLSRALGAARLAPLAGEPPARLARRRAGRAGADVACYFDVHDPAGADDLADRLREHELIEFAYVKPPIALPSAVTDSGDLRPNQGYLDDPPGGIGAASAWERPGGRGAGVRLIDVESSWRFTHEDLARGGLAGGRPADDVERRNHGTNVLGMLAARHDGRGVHGICPDAAIRAVSYQPEDRWGSARAIKHAADRLRPGDIMLLEMMRPGPRTPPDAEDAFGYLPVDYWPDDLTAIQYATSLGVIVVEAAGNGAQHLDDGIYAGPGPGFRPHRPNPFMRDGLDSGAVVVGAGAPPSGDHGPDRSRLPFSNWGSAIDAQGWGRDVTTTGGLGRGDETRPEDRWYTDRFSGTSSAAPMVAGALACVQGVLRAAGRRPLLPAQARRALRETGSPQEPAGDGTRERIGNRPDIAQLIEWAMEETPQSPIRRPTQMRVTITIDDGEGGTSVWQPSGIEPPYIKGPSLILTQEDGTQVELDIAALKAAAEEKKQAG